MNERYIDTIASELSLAPQKVLAAAGLLAEGATVPFIARYRKEATGSLDEVAITGIRDRLSQLEELDMRRETIVTSLEKNGHLTGELKTAVLAADTLSALEDLYLPFRPKRRTKGIIAREKGLEPLAQKVFAQEGVDPTAAAADFIDPQKQVETIEEALAGARDIMAEWMNEDASTRQRMRELFFQRGTCSSRIAMGKEKDGSKFKDYFEWEEPIAGVPSHRLLAMRRGEKEDILNLTMAPPETEAKGLLLSIFVRARETTAGRWPWQPKMPTAGCCHAPWKRRSGSPPRRVPTPRPSRYSRTTCRNFYWLRPWDRKESWASTRVFAPAASWSA
jgi:uncharacterized protein